MTQQLHRYWLRLDTSVRIPVGFKLGCGVTAFSQEDALEIIRQVYPKGATLIVTEIVADVSLSDLERNHVLPNVGDYTKRGVWFPNFGPAPRAPQE